MVSGEPVKSVEKGTYDILELGVFVSIRSSNNIVFNITDREAIVTPAPYAPNALDPNCHVFEIEVEKYFDTGDLVFTTPGTTENDGNWTTEVIFPNGLTLNPDGVSYPWVLMSGDDFRMHVVKVKICAPDDAPAGLGKAVTIKAHLKDTRRFQRRRFCKSMSTTFIVCQPMFLLSITKNSRLIRGIPSFSRQP